MDVYNSVINSRYRAPILSKVWSPENRIKTMRQLWIDLAFFQKSLGVESITQQALDELTSNRDTIDYNLINEYELYLKHDIMAHIHAYSGMCPNAGKIIHLGATSNFINDNSDSIMIKSSLNIVKDKVNDLLGCLKQNALNNIHMPTIAYTHLQPAQLITIGRRFMTWHNDVNMDMNNLLHLTIPFRGIKGTVGSEDTLLKLFKNDTNKCSTLNQLLCDKYGFENHNLLCTQTYSRKYDVEIIHSLSSICQSIYKMMNDLRLLSGKMEVYENFSKHQVGSSAMPYKKNPINCEKVCSLCRYVINQEQSMNQTYMAQWLERSLDDSAIKRIIFPECFLLMEYILDQSINIIDNLAFNYEYIDEQVQKHMTNVISEEIILKGVEKGQDRQKMHEELRLLLTSGTGTRKATREHLMTNDVIKNIIVENDISFNPNDYIGRCVEQINFV